MSQEGALGVQSRLLALQLGPSIAFGGLDYALNTLLIAFGFVFEHR